MEISGSKRENKEFGKVAGIFEAAVIAVNPDREELEIIYGGEQEKDPEYLKEKDVVVGKDAEGEDITETVNSARIVFFLKEKKTGTLLQATFYLEDRDKKNKDGTKNQYINGTGSTSWAVDAGSVPTWFDDGNVRVAKVGEEELYGFAKAWLGGSTGLDFSKKTTKFDLGFSDLIKGNVKGLKNQLNGEYAGTVIGVATIRTVEKDGEIKEYQGVYNRSFLPGYNIKFFKTAKFTPEIIDGYRTDMASKERRKNVKPYQRFVANITDGEYGIKDFYILDEIKTYDPAQNVAAGNDVKASDPNSSDY